MKFNNNEGITTEMMMEDASCLDTPHFLVPVEGEEQAREISDFYAEQTEQYLGIELVRCIHELNKVLDGLDGETGDKIATLFDRAVSIGVNLGENLGEKRASRDALYRAIGLA